MLFILGFILVMVGVYLPTKAEKSGYWSFLAFLGVISIIVFFVGQSGFYNLTSEEYCKVNCLENYFDYQKDDNIYYLTTIDDDYNFETKYYRINVESISDVDVTFETGKEDFPVLIKRLKGNSKLAQWLFLVDSEWTIDGYTFIIPENYFAFGKLENISSK